MIPKETRDTLKRMTAKGLIDLKKGDGEFTYALRPFIVGFYEGQLPRMDKEMAELFEQYYPRDARRCTASDAGASSCYTGWQSNSAQGEYRSVRTGNRNAGESTVVGSA